jgi:hypothetical protein
MEAAAISELLASSPRLGGLVTATSVAAVVAAAATTVAALPAVVVAVVAATALVIAAAVACSPGTGCSSGRLIGQWRPPRGGGGVTTPHLPQAVRHSSQVLGHL